MFKFSSSIQKELSWSCHMITISVYMNPTGSLNDGYYQSFT